MQRAVQIQRIIRIVIATVLPAASTSASLSLAGPGSVAEAGSPRIVFVNASLSTGDSDGTSWANAYLGRLGLQQALSELPADTAAHIWIAAGEYAPAGPNGDPAAHFAMRNNLALFGGFKGGETSLEQRDIQANPVILTGDLNSDDVQNAGGFWLNTQDNANNVTIAENVNGSAVLDGVTVRRGVALVDRLNRRQGGNMRIVNASPTIRFCTVEHGQAGGGGGGGGGGMDICSGAPLVEDCIVRGNQTTGRGAGVYHTGSSSAIFRRCLFQANMGGLGAGLFNGCLLWDCDFAACGPQINTPTIEDCVFRDNIGFFGASSGPIHSRCAHLFAGSATG